MSHIEFPFPISRPEEPIEVDAGSLVPFQQVRVEDYIKPEDHAPAPTDE